MPGKGASPRFPFSENELGYSEWQVQVEELIKRRWGDTAMLDDAYSTEAYWQEGFSPEAYLDFVESLHPHMLLGITQKPAQPLASDFREHMWKIRAF